MKTELLIKKSFYYVNPTQLACLIGINHGSTWSSIEEPNHILVRWTRSSRFEIIKYYGISNGIESSSELLVAGQRSWVEQKNYR